MKYHEILLALSHQRHLASRRMLTSSRNRTAKVFIYLGVACMAIYLFFLATMLALSVNEDSSAPASAIILSVLPFCLLVDFGFRFFLQQTPAQMIRPYYLLPIPKYACIDSFLISSLISWGNEIWMLMVVPFALMSVLPREGFTAAIACMLFSQIAILVESQFYLLVRTLVRRSLLWWAMPIALLGLVGSPLLLPGMTVVKYLDDVVEVLTSVAHFAPLPWLLLLLSFVLILWINRRLQYACIKQEMMRTEKKQTVKKISSFSIFDRYGELGQWMKLELKLMLRNSHPRKMFIYVVAMCVFFLLFYIFMMSDDDSQMVNTSMSIFWCFYTFLIVGTSLTQRIMSYEGNYIDLLWVHRQHLLQIITAKYYFTCATLIIPLLASAIAIAMGKWTIIEVLACMLFTMGPVSCAIFRMAIYNNETIALDAKLMTRTQHGVNYFASLVIGLSFILVTIVFTAITMLFSANIASWMIVVVSIPFVATHRLWLRNIYNNMVKRKYENVAAFKASR